MEASRPATGDIEMLTGSLTAGTINIFARLERVWYTAMSAALGKKSASSKK